MISRREMRRRSTRGLAVANARKGNLLGRERNARSSGRGEGRPTLKPAREAVRIYLGSSRFGGCLRRALHASHREAGTPAPFAAPRRNAGRHPCISARPLGSCVSPRAPKSAGECSSRGRLEPEREWPAPETRRFGGSGAGKSATGRHVRELIVAGRGMHWSSGSARGRLPDRGPSRS